MAINGVLNFKDKNGDITTVYPVTSAENVAGLSAALAGKVDKESGKGLSANDYTTTEKNKLSGIEANANNYSLPTAAGNTLGGIKIGAGLSIDNGVASVPEATSEASGLMTSAEKIKLAGIEAQANKTVVDSSLSSSSTNPVQNKVVNSALGGKVDKVSGKGLSTNDYTTAEKNKLSGVEANANNYVHPTSSGNKHIPSGGSSGKILGWASDGTAQWVDDHNTEYDDATTSTHGLMSAADKTKLNGIATGANKTVVDSALNSTSLNPVQNKVINSALETKANDAAVTAALSLKVDKVSGKGLSTNDYTTTEKNKLSGIEAQANKYIHPTTAGNKHVPAGGEAGQTLRWSESGTASWVESFVTPEMFGAAGDGETNDAVAVQTALDHGGNVLFTGVYKCTTIIDITKSNTCIMGTGTIIGSFNADGPVLRCRSTDNDRIDHIRIKDINIQSGQTGIHAGILFSHELSSGTGFTDVVIDGVTVVGVTGNGIHLHGGPYNSSYIRPFISILNCKIFDVGRVGICESRVSSRIQKCLIRNAGYESITVDNGCYLTVISDNILQVARGGVGNIGVDECDRCVIANNQIVCFDYGAGHDSDNNCGVRLKCNTGNANNIIVCGNVFTGGKYGIEIGNSSTQYSGYGVFTDNVFAVIGVSDFKFDKIMHCVVRNNLHNKFDNDEFKNNLSNVTCDKAVTIPLSECVQEGFTLVGSTSDDIDNRAVVTDNYVMITTKFIKADKANGDIPFVLPFTVTKASDCLEQDGNEICLRTNGNVQIYGDYANMADEDVVEFTATFTRFR